MITRIGVTTDGLQAAGAVDMRDGGNLRPLFSPDLEDPHRERDGVVLLEPLGDGFGEHDGGKGRNDSRLPISWLFNEPPPEFCNALPVEILLTCTLTGCRDARQPTSIL
jgi:hypothetical protein